MWYAYNVDERFNPMTAASFQLTGYWINIVQNALVLTEFREITPTIILYLNKNIKNYLQILIALLYY